MSEHREPKYDGYVLVQLRRRHNAFVNAQAVRLGVEPSAILAAVRDFGLTASDIAKLTEKSGLTKYANGHGLNIIDFQHVRRTRDTNRQEFTAPQPGAKRRQDRKPRREPAAQKRRDRERMSKWLGDGSMADALRKVGLRK